MARGRRTGFGRRDFPTLRMALVGLASVAALPALQAMASGDGRSLHADRAASVYPWNVSDAAADSVEAELEFQRTISARMQGAEPQVPRAGVTAPNNAATRLLGALMLLESGDAAAAKEELTSLQAIPGAPREVEVYLALAEFELGNPDAAAATLKRYVQQYPNDRVGNFALGLLQAVEGNTDQAKTRLAAAGVSDRKRDEILLASHDNSSGSLLASRQPVQGGRGYRYNAPPGTQTTYGRGRSPAERPWSLTFLVAQEYDSNVAAAPDFDGLGAIADKDDMRTVLASFGDWRIFERQNLNIGLVGSTLNNFHYDHEAFDLEDYMGGAYTNAAVGSTLLGVRYEFHETRLGGEHLVSDHRLVPSITCLGYDWGHTTVYYEFSTAISNAPALIPAQVQSADVNSIGLTQAIYTFGGDGRIYFGYRFDNVTARGDDFDRDSHMVTGRLERPLACGWIADFEVRHFWDDYDNPNSLDFFERTRQDSRLELRTGLQKLLSQHLALRFDYTFINQDSNVENLFGVRFFEFERHIFNTQLIYDF